MPKTETILQVFVASPSDVAEERRVLEEVIRELNVTWSDTLAIRLDLIKWETHAAPGFGDDPQDVINEQIPTNYDIFVGLMWTRFGTATKRAGSGTAEEFERAHARHQQEPDSIEIMFYFKNAPIQPSDIDLEQLRAVSEFRSRLGSMGGLYFQFISLDEFRNSVRLHLSRAVQKWVKRLDAKRIPQVRQTSSSESANKSEALRDDEGFLDLVETASDSIKKVSEGLTRMTEAVQDLGQRFQTRIVEADDIQTASGSPNLKAAKRVAENAAQDLQDFVSRMNVEIPLFSESFSTAMNSFGRAAALTTDFRSDNSVHLRNALDNVISFRSGMIQSRDQIRDFRGRISAFPRMTTAFNRARRETLATLDTLLQVLDTGDRQSIEVETLLSELIKQYEGGSLGEVAR